MVTMSVFFILLVIVVVCAWMKRLAWAPFILGLLFGLSLVSTSIGGVILDELTSLMNDVAATTDQVAS